MDLNQALIERAQHVIPGGVNSPVRAFGSVGGAPRFIERAKGPYMWDVTDKRFTDYVCSWGPMILGHNDPEVVEAVHAAVDRGLSFGAATRAEVEIAEMITNILPAMEEVRLVSSGTEAGMSAIRLARGYTGRNRIIKFEGCYHGHSDALLVKAGSGLLTFGNPSSAGVPASVTEHTMVLEYNNPEQLEDAFAKYGDEIACVIVEAFAGNMNLVRGTQEFIDTMRRLCTKHGALLIVDEVMTGFRVALKGAQSLFNVTPDITMLGKVIGGGMLGITAGVAAALLGVEILRVGGQLQGDVVGIGRLGRVQIALVALRQRRGRDGVIGGGLLPAGRQGKHQGQKQQQGQGLFQSLFLLNSCWVDRDIWIYKNAGDMWETYHLRNPT